MNQGIRDIEESLEVICLTIGFLVLSFLTNYWSIFLVCLTTLALIRLLTKPIIQWWFHG